MRSKREKREEGLEDRKATLGAEEVEAQDGSVSGFRLISLPPPMQPTWGVNDPYPREGGYVLPGSSS